MSKSQQETSAIGSQISELGSMPERTPDPKTKDLQELKCLLKKHRRALSYARRKHIKFIEETLGNLAANIMDNGNIHRDTSLGSTDQISRPKSSQKSNGRSRKSSSSSIRTPQQTNIPAKGHQR